MVINYQIGGGVVIGESQKEVIRPDFNRPIRIDFQGAQVSLDVGFRERLRRVHDHRPPGKIAKNLKRHPSRRQLFSY